MRRAKFAVILVMAGAVLAGIAITYQGLRQGGMMWASFSTPTFSRDVAPIVFSNCSTCHHPGGSAPFDLLTYEDVKNRASQIVAVTEDGYMPPWLPNEEGGPFAGERRLSSEHAAILSRWVETGCLEGDPAELPAAPTFESGWQLGEPDLIVRMPEPYTLPAGDGDVFRSFVIPVPTSERRLIKAIEFQPGNPQVVHHVVILIDPSRSARQYDEQDPDPGFEGMNPADAHNPDGHFLGWTPGKRPLPGIEGMAWQLEPETDLVIQAHMLPSGKPEIVQSTIGLFFADAPPTRTPTILRLGPRTIDIAAGQDDYSIGDSYQLPVDVDVLSVYPHAHYLGKEMRGLATFPDGTQQWLLHIDDWDFNWQDEYRYEEPVFLPKGTTISMHFTYDNSEDNPRNPSNPPRRVLYGPQSSDEMGDLRLQVVPRNRRDFAILKRDFAHKELGAEIAGYEHGLQSRPDDVEILANLGAALSAADRSAEAIGYLKRALELQPDHARSLLNLATILSEQSHFDDAILHFRRALKIEPDYAEAHNNLANALVAKGQYDEAITHYRRVLQIRPNDARAHYNLGIVLAEQKLANEAIEHFRSAARSRPEFLEARYSLAEALAAQKQPEEAIHEYQEILKLSPHSPRANYLLGALLLKAGRFAGAKARFEDVLKVQSQHTAARTLLHRARNALANQSPAQ